MDFISFDDNQIKQEKRGSESIWFTKNNDWLKNLRLDQIIHTRFGFYKFENIGVPYINWLKSHGVILAMFIGRCYIFILTSTKIEV